MSLDDTSLRLLYGRSTFIPELDEEEQENRDENAITEYETYLLTNSIGTESFEYNFLVFSNSILGQDIEDLKNTVERILERMEDVYGFGFFESVNMNSKNDLENIIDLIKFVEFDNLQFLTDVWSNLQTDPLEVEDIPEYCNQYSTNIVIAVDSMLEVYTYNKFIISFLRTYNKDNLISWFSNKSEENSLEISNLMIGEE